MVELNVFYFKSNPLSALCIVLLTFSTLIGREKAFSLAEINLGRILDAQIKFFHFAKNSTPALEGELTRKAQEIVTSYEDYLAENPGDINALLLFAKFLQKVGQSERAIDYYLEADQIDPKLAVVKQQIANHLIKEGRPLDAFPFLMMTAQIAPQEATYHFEIGNYIHLFSSELVDGKILSSTSVKSMMRESFKQAFLLSPDCFEYVLRYGQSFFDDPNSDKLESLKIWDSLLTDFPNRTNTEIDYLKLCKARVLIELNRREDAKELIQTVNSKDLKKSKVSLLKQAEKEIIKRKEPSQREKKNINRTKTGFRFPTDEHLKRMRLVSDRLNEERLLSELKLDVLKAGLDYKGNVKIEFSDKTLLIDNSVP